MSKQFRTWEPQEDTEPPSPFPVPISCLLQLLPAFSVFSLLSHPTDSLHSSIHHQAGVNKTNAKPCFAQAYCAQASPPVCHQQTTLKCTEPSKQLCTPCMGNKTCFNVFCHTFSSQGLTAVLFQLTGAQYEKAPFTAGIELVLVAHLCQTRCLCESLRKLVVSGSRLCFFCFVLFLLHRQWNAWSACAMQPRV